MSDPKPWNEQVSAVLKEAEQQGWVSGSALYIDITDVTYDPVEGRINSKVRYSALAIQDMLKSGWAKIENGQVVLLDAPLPETERTTHMIKIVVRESKPR